MSNLPSPFSPKVSNFLLRTNFPFVETSVPNSIGILAISVSSAFFFFFPLSYLAIASKL